MIQNIKKNDYNRKDKIIQVEFQKISESIYKLITVLKIYNKFYLIFRLMKLNQPEVCNKAY